VFGFLKKKVTKIMSKSSWVTGKIKVAEKQKNFHKFLLHFSKFQPASHQPISSVWFRPHPQST